MKISYIAASAAVLCLAAVSCGDAQFRIDGDVTGAEGRSLVLEKSDFHGRWIPVDSVKIGGSGHFSIRSDAPASPEVYRLSLGDRFIYLPVDSYSDDFRVRFRASFHTFGYSAGGTHGSFRERPARLAVSRLGETRRLQT